ncbi:MAG: hypothetical protein EOO01_37200 [Chitinophagaceae bacterium]|nr:MAG: hypothetical protein EOO01_37200 [Chitinophagaceae bacterium]
MKYIWCAIFSLFLVTKPLFPLVEYVTNYDYIATVLCVNKTKPEMHCNGKCHLMQELAKASASDEQSDSTSKKGFSFGDSWFYEPAIVLKSAKAIHTITDFPDPISSLVTPQGRGILRPPISI